MVFKNNDYTNFHDDPPIPFNDDKPEEYIRFKCKVCGFEEDVPADIVDESFIPEEFDEETRSPIVLWCDTLQYEKYCLDSDSYLRTDNLKSQMIG